MKMPMPAPDMATDKNQAGSDRREIGKERKVASTGGTSLAKAIGVIHSQHGKGCK